MYAFVSYIAELVISIRCFLINGRRMFDERWSLSMCPARLRLFFSTIVALFTKSNYKLGSPNIVGIPSRPSHPKTEDGYFMDFWYSMFQTVGYLHVLGILLLRLYISETNLICLKVYSSYCTNIFDSCKNIQI